MPTNDTYTTLNTGSGGDAMDETSVSYGSSPTTRKRARVVISGDAAQAAIIDPLNTTPTGTEYGLPVRTVGGTTVDQGTTPWTVAGYAASNSSAATWTSSTSINTVVNVTNNSTVYNTVVVSFNQTTTITGGAVTFEGSIDGSNWLAVQGVNSSNASGAGSTYAFQASTYVAFQFNITGLTYFRVRLSTTISGSGSVLVQYTTNSLVNPTLIVANGTVTSNQGTANTLANAWSVEVTDGINVLGTSSHPVRIDPTGTTTQPVSGTVTTSPPSNASTNVTQIGSNAVVTGGTNGSLGVGGLQATNTALVGDPIVIAGSDYGGTAKAQNLKVDSSGFAHVTLEASTGTTTVSGTVTADQGGAPWSSNVTEINGATISTAASGIQKVGIVGSTGTALDGTTAGILDANIKDVGGSAVSTAAAGIIKVGISDSTGTILNSVTKGSQAANALGVQDLKDSGRGVLTLTYTNTTSTTTTTTTVLTTLVQNSNYASSTGVTSFQVPAGKTLRLQSLTATASNNSTTTTATQQQVVYVEVRVSTTNTTTALSTAPIACMLAVPINGSSLLFGNGIDAAFPDGIEVPASDYVGISTHNAVTQVATTLMNVVVIGYTY